MVPLDGIMLQTHALATCKRNELKYMSSCNCSGLFTGGLCRKLAYLSLHISGSPVTKLARVDVRLNKENGVEAGLTFDIVIESLLRVCYQPLGIRRHDFVQRINMINVDDIPQYYQSIPMETSKDLLQIAGRVDSGLPLLLGGLNGLRGIDKLGLHVGVRGLLCRPDIIVSKRKRRSLRVQATQADI